MPALIDIQQRDEELYQAYRKAFAQKGMTHNKAIRTAINTPTSRYWVSPAYVYREILARFRGYQAKYDPSSRRKQPRPCRIHMHEELFRIYKQLAHKHYFRGCSTYFLVTFVVNHPAPSFHVSFRQAQRIIARKRKEAINKYFHQNA